MVVYALFFVIVVLSVFLGEFWILGSYDPFYLSLSHCFRIRTQQILGLVVLIILPIVAVGAVENAILDVVVQTNSVLMVCDHCYAFFWIFTSLI